MPRKLSCCSLFFIIATGLSGCGGEIPQPLLDAVAQRASMTAPSADSKSDVGSPPQPVVFTPPYPERVDPFRYPDDQIVSAGNESSLVGRVQVLGFASVREPRVVLKIDETTHTPKVGDKPAGIEVVRITPPTVQLRRGQFSWSASLFEKTTR